MNLGREDNNKHGWVLGQIMHIARTIEANKYDYCDYSSMDIPTGALVRIIGIKQTDLNACYAKDGQGDVYIDFEFLNYFNDDGTPVTCGNRHSWTLAEASPDFMLCPDGSGEPGYLRPEGCRDAGLWHSLEAKRIEDHPEHHYVQFQYRKVVDPTQYGVEV